MLQIAQTRDRTTTKNIPLQCKCLHIAASVQHFNRSLQCPQMLHFYSSVSQKRPQSAAVSHKPLWFSASFFPPCHLPFASENQQGNASEHLSCKHAASCILHKENLCKCLAKTSCTSPFTGNIHAAKFSSK